MEKIIEFSKLQEAANEQASPHKPKKKKRPPKKMNKHTKKFAIIMSVLTVCLLALLYLQLPISHIATITVNKTTLKTTAYYEQQSGLQRGESLWRFKNSDIEHRLTQEKTVKKATVYRTWPSEVQVKITEHQPVAYIRDSANHLEYVLENGAILPTEKAVTEIDMPIMTGFSDEKKRQHAVEQLRQLDEEMLHSISEISPNNKKKYGEHAKLYMNDGNIVYIDVKNLAYKLQYYPAMVMQAKKGGTEKGVYHMEVANSFKKYKKE